MEDQGSGQQGDAAGDETQESLREASEAGESKGTGISPGVAGQSSAGDQPASGGQTPPV